MDHSSVLHQHQPSYPSIDPSSSSDISSASRQHDLMAYLECLKEFLATAPTRWPTSPSDAIPPSQQHPALNRFLLPSNEYVTCVNWNNRYYITGTDIVRALVLRFEAFGRPVKNMKKFEEGIFSDLRNLKPGQDACLEDPKSPFLDLLFKYQCIRTQKKQKVFHWFSVPHDRLFIDALERDLKREKIGLGSTTSVVAEPALSFSYEPKRPLFEQLNAATLTAPTAESRSTTTVLLSSQATKSSLRGRAGSISLPDLKIGTTMLSRSSLESPRGSTWEEGSDMSTNPPASNSHSPLSAANSPTTSGPSRGHSFFNMFAFLEGTPTYKQRRKKVKNRRGGCSIINDDDHRMRHSLEMHSARRSFDVAPRGYEYEGCNGIGFGRHSLDSFQGHTNFLNGSAHYGFSHPGPQRIRVPNLPETTGTAPPPRPSLPPGITTTHAPTPGHVCPLYTCRQIFSTPEQLQHHISRHTERSGGGPSGMDVDPEGQREQLFVHTLTATTTTAHPIPIPAVSRNLSGSPEIPTFTHVLTTPDGSPRYDYDYEDDSGYAAPDWSHHHQPQQHHHHHVSAKIQSHQHTAQNAVYERPPPPLPAQGIPHIAPQPMHPSRQYQVSSYAFETTSVGSVSSASSSYYPPPSPTYPVSAPANQLTFSIPEVPPIMSDNNYVQNRRPRSVTPSDSQPVHRPTHGRRPSTATAVPTASFGGGGGGGGPTTPFGVGRSNSLTTFTLSSQQPQQQPAQQQVPSSWRIPPRGYHPYAAPDHSTRPSTSYSTSSAQSSQGSSSPFAVHMSAASGNEYIIPCEEQPGEYLQEPSGIKYEPQDYHITREPEYVAKEACHQVEYASTSEISPSGYEMAAIDQLHGEYAVDDNAGGEYMSSDPGTTTQQGYISQEPSPEAQFVQLTNNLSYPEDSYNDAVNVGSQDYPIQAEDVADDYHYAPDMSAEVAVPYDSGHGHSYPMQMGHHHHHHDVQMLPYYQQQVA